MLKVLQAYGVWSQAVLLDGRLATGSDKFDIRLWNVADRACSCRLTESGRDTRALSAGADDHGTEVGCSATAASRANYNTTLPGTRLILALAVPAPDRLASAGSDYQIKIWDTKHDLISSTLTKHQDKISALALLPSSLMASADLSGHVKLWDVGVSKCVGGFKAHNGMIWPIAALPDGRLATGGADCVVKLWDVSVNLVLSAYYPTHDGALVAATSVVQVCERHVGRARAYPAGSGSCNV
jgi:WD40 repeat protein